MAFDGLIDKAKSVNPHVFSKVSNLIPKKEGSKTISELQNKEKELIGEKSKLYSYLGMEIYDLHVAGSELPQQAVEICTKLDEISNNLELLRKEIEQLEQKPERSNVCKCGEKLSKSSRFCPSCGIPTEFPPLVCTCGAKIAKGKRFCQTCGKAIGADASDTDSGQTVSCVCGATVDANQPMCMECGRRVVTSE